MKALLQLLLLLSLTPSLALAAKTQYLELSGLYIRPASVPNVHRYAINLASSQQPLSQSEINPALGKFTDLVYLNKVKVNNSEYFRLVAGNYPTQKIAKARLREIKRIYPGAWLNFRNRAEINALSKRLRNKDQAKAAVAIAQPIIPKVAPTIAPEPKAEPEAVTPIAEPTSLRQKPKDQAERLMIKARKLFLDGKYARVLATTDKIVEVGNQQQREIALEMSGLVRERQDQLAQAISIYREFLEQYPDSKIAPRIQARLDGLSTMFKEPSEPLANKPGQSDDSSWNMLGSLSQYYRNDTLDIDGLGSRDLSELLLTDVYLLARRKSSHSALELRYDGGLVSDLLDDHNNGRTRQALVNYSNTAGEYQIIGGRQNRTARGVYNRFDGVVFNGNTQGEVVYSLYAGAPVYSTQDGVNGEQVFAGGSLHWKYSDALDLDFYLMQQQVEGLTDRQALGSELQFRGERGFVYGILDYDLFYGELNNLTAVGNYRYSEQLTLNGSFSHVKSPLLSTYNALQGQQVSEFAELQDIHGLSDEQIYDLARARTSDSNNLSLNAAYQLDPRRHLDLGLILSSIDATESSPATASTPAIAANDEFDSTHLSLDYTIKSYFIAEDYTTFGARIIDNSSAQTLSIQGRSRLPGAAKRLYYDPRLSLDLRHNDETDIDQYILRARLRIKYRPNRNWSLEADAGWEYSDEDLPDNNTQSLYSLLFGYRYQF